MVSAAASRANTNPEELIGAAHAGCFTMALSLILGEAKLTTEHMETTAEVSLDKVAERLRHHRRPSDLESQGARREPDQIRGACGQGQGRLSRF